MRKSVETYSALTILLLFVPFFVQAQGLTKAVPFAGTAQTPLIGAVQTIINVLLMLIAIVAAIYLIVGGLQFITSSGDETQAGKGKKNILYAVIGLIVVGLSAAIVNFVIDAIALA
ncbi:MAG: DUF6112 family protein [Candidatus Andersenbacteria bacterium]